jgi:hypothetical protein
MRALVDVREHLFQQPEFIEGNSGGRNSIGKSKGIAVRAKVVQILGSDKEIQGTEKCADTKSKICAELCHQGIGLSFTSFIT